MVFITHDLSLLVEISDRIAIMYGGRIVEEAKAAELYRDPLHPYSDGLLHSFPALRGPAPRAVRDPRLALQLNGHAGRLPVRAALSSGLSTPASTDKPAARRAGRPRRAGRTVACWLHPAEVRSPVPPSPTTSSSAPAARLSTARSQRLRRHEEGS